MKKYSIYILAVCLLWPIQQSCSWNVRHSSQSQDPVEDIELSAPAPTVIVDTTRSGLVIYYPSFSAVDLRCLERPDPDKDSTVVFCCAGAYTGKGAKGHSNIAGDHVSGGKRYHGYRCKRNTGAFVFYNGKWKFLYKAYTHELDSAAANNGCGYAQEMMIHDSLQVPTARPLGNVNQFRGLCEIDGKLAIAESTDKIPFGKFISSLLDAGATEALYTDMGNGWNYSWYREYADKRATLIHPGYQEKATNWLVFLFL